MSGFFCDNGEDYLPCCKCGLHAEFCDCPTMQWEDYPNEGWEDRDEGADNAEKWAERGGL